MNTRPLWRRVVFAVSALAALSLLLTAVPGPALAKKPVKPPPVPLDGGAIYITARDNPVVHRETLVTLRDTWYPTGGPFDYKVNPDVYGTQVRVFGMPSEELHADRRWFLEYRKYPEGLTSSVPTGDDPIDPLDYPQYHPCGSRRFELYAVSEYVSDGKLFVEVVQLTDDSTLRMTNSAWLGHIAAVGGDDHSQWMAQWANNDGTVDGKVSFLAVRWNAPATNGPRLTPSALPAERVPDSYDILEAGLFVLEIDWSTGKPVPIDDPELIYLGDRVEEEQFEFFGTGGKLFTNYTWTPDGDSLLFSTYDPVLGDTDYTSRLPPEGHENDSKYPGYSPVNVFPGLWRLEASDAWDIDQAVQISNISSVHPEPGALYPDGSVLAVEYDKEIYIIDVTADGLQPLTRLVPLVFKTTELTNFRWSPQGVQAVFQARFPPIGKKDGYWGLYMVNPDGSDAVQILDGHDVGGPGLQAIVDWR